MKLRRKSRNLFLVFFVIILIVIGLWLIHLSVLPASPKILWKKDAHEIIGNLAIHQEVLYFGTLDGTYQALDTKSGILRWQAKLPNGDIALSLPEFSDNNVYVLGKKQIYSFDISSGKLSSETFHFQNKDFTYSSTTQKHLFTGDKYNYIAETKYNFPGDSSYIILYALDKNTGKKQWQWKDHLYPMPLFSEGTLYFLSNNTLYAVQ